MDDPWSAFENGVARLLGQMGREHTRYADVLTLQSRLLEISPQLAPTAILRPAAPSEHRL